MCSSLQGEQRYYYFGQTLATPILYFHIKLRRLTSLEILHNVLQSSDQQWDSLRRIPYSTRADGYNRWTSQGLLTLSPRGLPNCIPIPFSAICFVSRHYFPLWHCIQRSTSVGER